ncbi:MAG: M23 family metallopeptidase [Ilumatobacteraceae bacterium]
MTVEFELGRSAEHLARRERAAVRRAAIALASAVALAAPFVGPSAVVAEPATPAAATAPAATAPTEVRAARSAPAQYRFPVPAGSPRYTTSHHDYPATDLAVSCGTPVVAVTAGVIWEVERVDRYDPNHDVPAARGGRTVVLDGDDGARYLYAHLSSIRSDLDVGDRVTAGDAIGAVGSTGRSTGCHLHLGISPQCDTRIWDLLAGMIWPWRYLDAWRVGSYADPGAEIQAWMRLSPELCAVGGALVESDRLGLPGTVDFEGLVTAPPA